MRASLMLVYGELDGLWRIGNDYENFRVLRPPYKLQLLCNGAHASNLLPLLGRNWNPRMMKRQGLVFFVGGPPRDFDPTFGFDGPLPVGVVFFPSPVLGNVSGESSVLLVPLSPFSPLLPSLLPLSLFSSFLPLYLLSSLLPLSLLSSSSPSLSHSLFLSFSVFLPLFPSPFLLIFLLLPLLVRTLFFSLSSFFLREPLVLFISEM